jgi:HSP20 family molecular chaperone IbpA
MNTLTKSEARPSTIEKTATRRPTFRVEENERAATLRVYLPGVSKEAINLEFEKNRLRLRAGFERNLPEGVKVLHQEISDLDYAIEFETGEGFDAEHISAEYNEGVLTLTLPKAAEAQPRRISVA